MFISWKTYVFVGACDLYVRKAGSIVYFQMNAYIRIEASFASN